MTAMRAVLSAFLLFFCLGIAQADEEFHCEVLTLQGKVTAMNPAGEVRTLKEGDLVASGEIVETAEVSSVDLAFDKEWKNVTRVESDSRMKVGRVFPTLLELNEGGVFAKLKSLPKDSSFEVKTPTAVASVRGTEYRTTFMGGQTQVFNVSTSKVHVYGISADGSVDIKREVVLEQSNKTLIERAGEAPQAPQVLAPEEEAVTLTIADEIRANVQKAETSGRVANIQSISDLETSMATQVPPNDTDESRVVDLRRRPFKKAA
jgi:hypothetical protein